MQEEKLSKEFKKLREEMDGLRNRFSAKNMFLGGMLRGAGILVGATLLVLVGGIILNLLGFLPGFSDVVNTIVDAFEKAKLQ